MVVLRLDAHGARARAVGELDPSSWRGPNVGVEKNGHKKKRYNYHGNPQPSFLGVITHMLGG